MSAIRTILDRVQGKAPKGARRSPHWSAYRKHFMQQHPECASCLRKSEEAHHIVPFHVAPDLELNPTNLIAMCRRCHLFVGHLGSWRRVNFSVAMDAAYWKARMEAQ